MKLLGFVATYKFYKRDCLHRDWSYSVSLEKSKQFNSYIQKIQSKYHGFNKNNENNESKEITKITETNEM